MSESPNGAVPRSGRVNEICQEWMIREDGAIAYHLQNQEIKQHYSGNKQRNALVREDYPRAKNEQEKEKELAEQATAIYKKMLEQQEEEDKLLAERLMRKIEIDEKSRQGMSGINEDLLLPKKIQNEPVKPPVFRQFKPSKYLVSTSSLSDKFDSCPEQKLFDKDSLRSDENPKSQLEADAELARILQEEEGDPEECIQERDRLLAIEAQDKELARVLQERERIKAKKAREKARQKALAKKHQKMKEGMDQQIMPDDAYSNPVDAILPSNSRNTASSLSPSTLPNRVYDEYEDNYSLPVEEVPPQNINHIKVKSPHRKINEKYPSESSELDQMQLSNIAMAIDPTYAKHEQSTSKSPGKSSLGSPSKYIDDKLENSPPYMPIQGQKRTTSLEKKRMRDGCKQQ